MNPCPSWTPFLEGLYSTVWAPNASIPFNEYVLHRTRGSHAWVRGLFLGWRAYYDPAWLAYHHGHGMPGMPWLINLNKLGDHSTYRIPLESWISWAYNTPLHQWTPDATGSSCHFRGFFQWCARHHCEDQSSRPPAIKSLDEMGWEAQ